jgi:hypothetical protein
MHPEAELCIFSKIIAPQVHTAKEQIYLCSDLLKHVIVDILVLHVVYVVRPMSVYVLVSVSIPVSL